jgi:transcriptional regulator with PAS, ATPase and Fis domain
VKKRRQDAVTTVKAAPTGDTAATTARNLLVVGSDLIVTKALPPRGELVIGRDDGCDLVLPDAGISRRHARLIVDDDLTIEDVGSTNGIKVGSVRIERGKSTALLVGENVRLGPYSLIVLGADAAAVGDDGLARAALVVDDPTVEGKTELIERIARHAVNVLIQGETGTGKEVLARTLHALSQRPGEIVAINCAALSGALLESELFGHERGAFTGATRTKPGLLEIAGKGTALLDEIGDLPLELQGKLLRAIESRQVYRVGGVQPIELGARLIAATHRDLLAEVARGTFRQDLYFRLNGITLAIRPLRERPGSIIPLANRFLEEAGGRASRFAPAALAALTAHDWPGNVRELRQVVERAALLAGDLPIGVPHILLSPSTPPAVAGGQDEPGTDRDRFVAIARANAGNTTAIAQALGTSRSHVRRLAQKYEVDLGALRRTTS